MALDDVLETLTEIVELAESDSAEPLAPEPNPRTVESLEERLPLSAPGAAPLETGAITQNDSTPPEAKASLLPTPSIPADLAAELHARASAEMKAQMPLVNPAAAREALGELEQELALPANPNETPGTPHDGRIASKPPEPVEDSQELDDRHGDQERLEIPELEPKEQNSNESDGHHNGITNEDQSGVAALDDAMRGEPCGMASEQPLEAIASQSGLQVSIDLIAKTDLRFIANLGGDLGVPDSPDEPGRQTSNSDISSELSEDDVSVGKMAVSPQDEASPKSHADGQVDAHDSPARVLGAGTNPHRFDQQSAEEASAHDACFSAPSAAIRPAIGFGSESARIEQSGLLEQTEKLSLASQGPRHR